MAQNKNEKKAIAATPKQARKAFRRQARPVLDAIRAFDPGEHPFVGIGSGAEKGIPAWRVVEGGRVIAEEGNAPIVIVRGATPLRISNASSVWWAVAKRNFERHITTIEKLLVESVRKGKRKRARKLLRIAKRIMKYSPAEIFAAEINTAMRDRVFPGPTQLLEDFFGAKSDIKADISAGLMDPEPGEPVH